jgi:hypothetical protein
VSETLAPPNANGSSNGSSNGAAPHHERDHARLIRQRIALIALIVIGAVWIFAIVWSVTVTTHSPERLDGASAATLSAACNDAQAQLKALPKSYPRLGADRVARIGQENAILSAMIMRFNQVHPPHSSPAKALQGWTRDWTNVVAARAKYAHDLQTLHRAELVLPATQGINPVTQRMDDFVRESHPYLDACFTTALQLDVVEGPRVYQKVTS